MAARDELAPHLEKVLEVAPGTLQQDMEVRTLKNWDSLKLLEILAFADEEFHVQVDADRLSKCSTVGDILKLLEDFTTTNL